jgi:SulP family sulfate permease
MELAGYKFNRVEFAGSLGDLGTLIPLSVALMMITGLGVTPVLMMVGIFYMVSGLYFRLPIPVQPLKVVSAIAIAYPAKITLSVVAASGMIFGVLLLFLAITGIIDRLSKFFTKPIMRGIQLGLGFILMNKGIELVMKPELFIYDAGSVISIAGISVNHIVGIVGFIVTLILLSSKRFPSALVVVCAGVAVGVLFGAFKNTTIVLGPTPLKIYTPGIQDFINAVMLLVIPQIPLTLGNAIMGTTDTCYSLFGKGAATKKASFKAFASSMGIMNLLTGMIGGMPMCHGSGGLAAHYRFGARTGGSNIMIGIVFLIIALVFGKIGISLLSSIPNAILGILLLFAGLELALLIKDVKEKKDLFLSFLIAGVAFATTNMGIAFFIGIIVMYLMKWKKIEI